MKTSNEGTKYMLGLANKHLTVLQERLVHAQTMTEVEVSYNFGRGKYVGKKLVYEQKKVVVVKGATFVTKLSEGDYVQDGVKVQNGEGAWDYTIFVFEKEQQGIVSTLTRNIQSVKGDIDFLNKKIVEWKP